MKKFVKVLITLMLAVAFVLPMAAVVHADDTPFDAITSKGYPISVQNGKVIYSGEASSFKFSELQNCLAQKSNSVRRIAAYSSNTLLGDDDNLKTGDQIKVESIDNSGETPVYTAVATYTMIVKGDVNMDGVIDISDSQYVVEYTRGNTIPQYSDALRSANSVAIILSGEGSISTNTGTYSLGVSFKSAQVATSVSYIQFYLNFPSFFTYSDFSIPSDMSGWTVTCEKIPSNNQLKITAYKQDFNGAVFDNSATTAKKLINLSFTLIASTNSGSEEPFTVSQGKGVSNNGGTFSAAGSNKPVTVGSVVPTAPTLNTKNETSITLNSVMGYQYYCSTSNALPSSTAEWFTASGQTITFSLLSPGTTYYIYYRRNSNETAYLMDGSIKTDSPAALKGPEIEKSDETSITVVFGANFEAIYFSPNSRVPSSYSTWITPASLSSSISGVGSYTVNDREGTVTFSELSVGKYYIFGKTASGTISDPTVWSPTPSFGEADISTTENTISLPYASVYKYSLDGRNFFSANTKTNLTASGSIYIQRETVNGNQNVVVIHGLDKETEYAVFVRVYDGSEIASEPCVLTIKTGAAAPTTPPAIKVGGRNQIYLAVEYNKSLCYRINGSAWTAAFNTVYPTEESMITLGDVAYYFSDATNPTFIVFTKLKPDTTYKIDAKFVDDAANTTNISTVTTKTIVCNHVYGDKVYVGNTLNYTQTCKICGNVISGTDQPVHTHTYETVTVQSTCTTKGYTYQKCSGCGAVLDGSLVELPLAPHTERTRVKSHATCTENGITEVYCAVCGAHIRDEISEAATGHRYELQTVPSTCKTHGYTVQVCSVCGSVLESSRQELPLLDHEAEWVTTVEATATSEGKKELICSRCGEVLDTEIIPKLISYIKNTNGTGTYEITVTENKALVSDAAKLAIADGDASVKVVFPEGVTVELDPAMTVAFLRNNAFLKVTKLTSDADASGNLEKAGFSSATHTVYEITAENAVIANGKATVTVKYQAVEGGGAVNVYFVDAQGKKTKMTSNYANGKLTFETTHFSTYVVEQGKAKSSNTGLVIAIIAIVAVILATGGTFGYMVYTSKKTKKRKFNF